MNNARMKTILMMLVVLFFISAKTEISVADSKEISMTKAVKINEELQRDVRREMKEVITLKGNSKKLKIQKCFVYGGDAINKTDRALIIEVSSNFSIEKDTALDVYTKVLKQVKKFNSKRQIPVSKVGVWFVNSATGETELKWILETEELSYLSSINFMKKQDSKMKVLSLLEGDTSRFSFFNN